MTTVTVSVERLVSEEGHCNYRVRCAVSDEVGPGESIGLVRAALHAECREHVRVVTQARCLQLEQGRLLNLAERRRKQAEHDLVHAEENAGEPWVDNLRETGEKGLVSAEATELAAEAIDFDEDWLPF